MFNRFKLTTSWELVGGLVVLLPFTALFQAYAATVTEGFESGSKGAYAAADVTLTSGVWNLSDALIGSDLNDRRSGVASSRVRNSGKLTMKFNRSTGAGSVSIKHAKYGADANTTWQLWCSTNSGSTWAQVGSTVTTSSTTLQTATFTANLAGTVRCEVRKTDNTSNRTNIDDITITDYGTAPSPSPSSSLPTGTFPFFDTVNNPVSGLAYGSPADVTPVPPTPDSFDNAVTTLCGAPGTVVSRTAFKDMMNAYPTVRNNIKTYVGGFLVAGRTTDSLFLDDLTNVWFNAVGFDHVFCGEPVQGGAIGGLHFVARYLELQNKGLAGRLSNNTAREEVGAGGVYTMGVLMKVGTGTAQSSVKGYPYTLNAEELLKIGALAYKNNPNTGSTSTACHLSVADGGPTFTTVFVRKLGGVRTFYPDATPGANPTCVQ